MNAMDPSNFFKVYANLPLKIREQVILVVEDKPITWNVAYIEIKNNTKISQTILEKLESLGVI